MTQAFDQYFLRSCGIAWPDDIYRICTAIRQGEAPAHVPSDERGTAKK
jgi:hypothetical protein